MTEQNTTGDSNQEDRPSPADFELYLPWACKQLQLEIDLLVTKIHQNEYISQAVTERSKKGKSRAKLTHSLETTTDRPNNRSSSHDMNKVYDRSNAKTFKVYTVYDIVENLVQIKLENNKSIPRRVVKIIGLIIQFQKSLNSVTINSGLDQYTVSEISKFLPSSHITDICLDNCCLKEPNYHLLLEKPLLKQLSLSRCKIDDITVENIFSHLTYPSSASKQLSVLNLSSNKITDVGADFIAMALRTNRQLYYLNLSNNLITDKGAAAILDILKEFPLTRDEVISARARLMTFLKRKNDMIPVTIRDLKLSEFDRKVTRRKSYKPPPVTKKTKLDNTSQKSLLDPIKVDVDNTLFEKAVVIVNNAVGSFVDPFSKDNIDVREGVTYCKGNNVLCSLNLSYNYLGYLTLRCLESTLLHQKLLDRKPRGLTTVSVEGNNMPMSCEELSQIDNILEVNLIALMNRIFSASKRRPQTKGTPRRYDA